MSQKSWVLHQVHTLTSRDKYQESLGNDSLSRTKLRVSNLTRGVENTSMVVARLTQSQVNTYQVLTVIAKREQVLGANSLTI